MNKMERESFVFYRSFYDCIKDLNDKQTRELVVAICERALDGNENEIDDKIVKMAYNLIKPQLDANTKRYVDGCKGGEYGVMGGRPKSTWDNSEKPQWGKKNNPSGSKLKTPNVNDNDNVNDNVNENDNEKGCGGKHEANNTLDAKASRLTTSGSDVGKDNVKSKKQIYEDEVSELKSRLANELSEDVINKVIEFDEVKKGKKIRKYKEPQIKSFITTINTWQTDKEKIAMLDTCIGNDYQGIYRNNKVQIIKQKPIEEGKVVNVNGANIFF